MSKTQNIGEAIRFHYIPTDLFTTDYFSVHFIMPLAKETVAGYTLLAKIFKKGNRAYPSQESFFKQLEELYAASLGITTSKHGEGQMISLSMEFLSSKFVFDGTDVEGQACSLLSDVLCDPYLENGTFSAAYTEREKTALRDQLRATLNNKRTYVLKRCREIMCEGEAYSLSLEGTEELIASITPESLYSLYLKMLREATIEIFYIGREPEDIATARARTLAAAFGQRAPIPYKTRIISRSAGVKRVTESVDASQGKLAMGFRTGLTDDSDFKQKDALVLFNVIYGTSPISKLFMNVREKRSLCYYCSSRNDNQKGVMFVQSGVENEKAAEAEEEILLQLKEIQEGNITDDEMIAAKQAFRDLMRSVSDSADSLEQWYLIRALVNDSRTPEECADAFDALTVEDVANVARNITLDTVFFLRGDAKEEGEADEELL